MAKVYTSSVIAAPVERVWEYLRDFNGLPNWFPGVTDSHIEPGKTAGQAGCVRNFGLEGGPRMREQLLAISDDSHSFSYKMLEGPLPVSSYQATVRLLPVTDGNQTFAELTSEFACAEKAEESGLAGFLSQTYHGAFERLKQHFGKS